MDIPFHQYLLDQIKQKFKSDTILAQEIMEITRQSKSNTYKKLKGAIPFSLEEAFALSRHFGISLDSYLQNGNDRYEKIEFDYSLPQAVDANNPASYLKKIRMDLEQLISLGHRPKLVYATAGLPLFHFLESRNLLAFKLFVWCRINWQIEGMENMLFDTESFYQQWPTIEADRLAIMNLYQNIDSKEFWPATLASNIINQVKHYDNSNFFQNPEMPAIIKKELADMLESRFAMAASGKKPSNDPEQAASFELFLNEMVYTNNIILIYLNDRPSAVYASMDNPNFLRSTNANFCTRMGTWMQRLELSSFDTKNEHHRLRLFRNLSRHLETT